MAVNPRKKRQSSWRWARWSGSSARAPSCGCGNDEPLIRDIQVISTGSISLDIALGVGGVPRGRIVEIYGPESSGKTTLCLHVVAEAQKKGGICGYIDAEHALDVGYARKLGVRTDDLLVSQPDTGEQGPGDRRDAGALRRHRRAGGRLGRGAGPQGRARRARWATPTWACRPG